MDLPYRTPFYPAREKETSKESSTSGESNFAPEMVNRKSADARINPKDYQTKVGSLLKNLEFWFHASIE